MDIIAKLDEASEDLRTASEMQSQAIHDISVALQEWLKTL